MKVVSITWVSCIGSSYTIKQSKPWISQINQEMIENKLRQEVLMDFKLDLEPNSSIYLLKTKFQVFIRDMVKTTKVHVSDSQLIK